MESLYRYWAGSVLTTQMGVAQACGRGLLQVELCQSEVGLEEVKQPELEAFRKSAG